MSLNTPPDDADFDIWPELRMRKILERLTPYRVEFQKNEQYKYDLKYFRWRRSDGQWVKTCRGYVELEHAQKWDSDDLPPSWQRNYFSALRRKVHRFNHRSGTWGGLKENAADTVYVKFNNPLTNCVAVPIRSLADSGRPTKKSDGSYKGSYLAIDWEHPQVRVGLNDAVSLLHSEFDGNH